MDLTGHYATMVNASLQIRSGFGFGLRGGRSNNRTNPKPARFLGIGDRAGADGAGLISIDGPMAEGYEAEKPNEPKTRSNPRI